MIYKPIAVRENTYKLIKDCETIFRKTYPEFDEMTLSINKVIYEMAKFYLRKTELEVFDDKN